MVFQPRFRERHVYAVSSLGVSDGFVFARVTKYFNRDYIPSIGHGAEPENPEQNMDILFIGVR